MRKLYSLLSLIVALLFIGCSGGSETTKITVAGSSTVRPIVEAIAESYGEQNPNMVIDVQGGGSSVGASSIASGLADIGMMSRELTDEESGTPITIGYDGIGLVIHADNPLTNITTEQVRGIYAGDLTNWSEFGLPDAPITVINKEESRGTYEFFASFFDLEGQMTKDVVVIGPNGQAIATLEQNRDAIAYVSIGAALGSINAGSNIRLVPLDGAEASIENVTTKAYPLQRPLYLVTGEEVSAAAQQFINYILGTDGQTIVSDLGFVPLSSQP